MADDSVGTRQRGKGSQGHGNALERIKKDSEAGESSDYASDMESHSVERPDKPVHRICESLLSSRSGFQNYRGLLNDCIILLVLSNSRNIINNLIKYGILVDPMKWVSVTVSRSTWPSWGLLILAWIFPLIALQTEKAAAKRTISDKSVIALHSLNAIFILLVPVVAVFTFDIGPLASVISMMWYTCLWMKLLSYAQVNWWCRKTPSTTTKNDSLGKKGLVKYPNNLYVKDMIYFCFSPTLCYELNFPRNEKIRKIFLIRRILEAVFILNVQLAIGQQWIMPTALNSLQPFKDMEYPRMIERVLLLALPNHLFWLLGFYWVFHSLMNLSAELLRFGDRKFYSDWWNSDTISRFWRTWNIPVHRWASRHIYNPLIKMGTHKVLAQLVVFLVSAFFHEYLVSIPLQMLRPWAFVGMISQIPLGFLTALPFMRGQKGNVVVWLSVVLGQPVAILMYLHDYYWIHWVPQDTTWTVNATSSF